MSPAAPTSSPNCSRPRRRCFPPGSWEKCRFPPTSTSRRSTLFRRARITSRRRSQNRRFGKGQMKKQYVNPKELGAPPRFYSHAVSVSAPAKLVYVSGQVSWGPDGNVVGKGDMRAQCEQVFKNVTAVLGS